MLKLRQYQDRFIAAILNAWLKFRAVLAVLPTGAGKTVCFAAIMHEHVGAAAAVVHRKEIVGQISMALAQLDVRHRIIAPPAVVTRIRRKQLKKFGKSYVDPHALVGVISVQTLTSRSSINNRELQNWVIQVTLAVFDEGHHYVKQGSWAVAVDLFARAKMLFVTATPERADGKGLGAHSDGYAETMIEGPTAKWLIDNGYLCRFMYFGPETDFDASDIPVTANGDLNTREMRKRVVDSHLVGDVVKQWFEFARGKQTIVFATDVDTAKEMCLEFQRAGVLAAELNADSDDRDDCVDDFEERKIQVLINVDLFDEGFDVPGVECVILARPTDSLAKYLQMVGRTLRVIYAKGYDLATKDGRLAAIAASEKPNAIIIDPVRNWERGHGMPTWPRRWTLDGRPKGQRSSSSDTIPQHVCKKCTQPFEKFYIKCPFCGAAVPEPAGRSRPDQVDGDLYALDVEGMQAVFEAMRAAEMTDEEFEIDMIKRNVPAFGRGVHRRALRADKYRREVLRNLIGWWVGAQDGRDLREVHRRFYFRFGIDIGTALTLSADETDVLALRISQRFSEDLAA